MKWHGRMDGEDALNRRLFQVVGIEKEYRRLGEDSFFLHGFEVDEGVKRNQGRAGASSAPDIIRENMGNFPVVSPQFRLYDFGNIQCVDGQLEDAQYRLANAVARGLVEKAKSIVLGGGHEVMYAHYSGLKKAFPTSKIGIINFDAHFDNRIPVNQQATSGTGFWQIASQGEIYSLHVGIQRNSNTLKLFDTAHQYGMNYILAEELFFQNLHQLYAKVDDFIKPLDILYLTICMDVFNASIAPGVSAPAYNGMYADHTFMLLYRHILQNKKLRALDVAEVNPLYDIQNRTARLAASLVNEWLMI
ncbi:formimidoylglutamase [Elizabethkingia argentiflava]|uniref:Formimidoylglutamase n=1 Tax=Elizabethkingia argenteiflava TaxID=2681556 RepID=A0A845PWF4_9FLAO|nr:formimidoylglutamase [Elizabethkingia argenteiflava]NAW51301.1 formimidoylglutamase [Elizabethkingia argenteiflava]